MDATKPIRFYTLPEKPTYDEVVALALRIAERENLHHSWIHRPDWVTPSGISSNLEARAKAIRGQAYEILVGLQPKPEWLLEERDAITTPNPDPHCEPVPEMEPEQPPQPAPEAAPTLDAAERQARRLANRPTARRERRRLKSSRRRFADVREPTPREITELAYAMAKETIDPNDEYLLTLILWPEWVSPPEEPLSHFMPWAQRRKEQAAAILRERYAKLPKRRLRKPPRKGRYIRSWTWIRRPLRNARPPPRKRRFRPPGLSPPRTEPPWCFTDAPQACPSRREQERLVFYDDFFDN